MVDHTDKEKPTQAKIGQKLVFMGKTDIYIGIDPDICLNGVAIVNRKTRETEVRSLDFCEVMDFFRDEVSQMESVTIVVEAGWLNDSVWHLQRKGMQWAASVGKAVGRNHQTGINIADMAEHMGFAVVRRKPLKKYWRGRDGKITHKELQYITGIKSRTNQETRDALLLAWVEAGLPVRLNLR